MAGLFSNLQQEIEFCRQTYPGFDAIAGDVESLLSSVEGFATGLSPRVGSHGKEMNQEHIDAFLGDGKSLSPEIKVRKDEFEELSFIICDGLTGICSEAQEAIWEFRQKLLKVVFPSCADVITADDAYISRLLEVSPKNEEMGRDLSTIIVSWVLYVFYRGQMNEDLQNLNSRMWDGGSCPVCGQSPHYALLDSEDGSGVLDCWLCGTRWCFMRLKCPYCHNQDHEKLGYFTIESMEICRVYFCRECNQYIKVFDLKASGREDADLLLHNLATLSVDLVAENEGFTAGSGLQLVQK